MEAISDLMRSFKGRPKAQPKWVGERMGFVEVRPALWAILRSFCEMNQREPEAGVDSRKNFKDVRIWSMFAC